MANLVSPFSIDPLRSATGFVSPGFIVDSNGNLSLSNNFTLGGTLSLSTGSISSGATLLISTTSLGPTVATSSLTSVGTLSGLTVSGTTTLSGRVIINSSSVVGTIDKVNIGSTTPGSGTFTTLSVSGDLAFNPTNEGTIDNIAIGNTTPAAGNFTSLTTSNDTALGGNISVAGNTTVAGTLTVGGSNIKLLTIALSVALG